MRVKRLEGDLTALIAVLLISSSYVFIKISLENLNIISLAAARSVIVALWFLAIIYLKRLTVDLLHLLKKFYFGIALMSITLVLAPNILINSSINLISPPAASFVESIEPAFTVFLARILLRERLRLNHVFGLALAMFGVLGIATEGFRLDAFSNWNLIGVSFALLSAFSLASANIIGKRLLKSFSPLYLTSLSFTIACFVLLPSSFLISPSGFNELFISTRTILALIGLGVVSTGIGYMLYFSALSQIKASRLAYYLYVIPPTTSLYNFILIGEAPSLHVLAFGALIIGSLWLAQRTS